MNNARRKQILECIKDLLPIYEKVSDLQDAEESAFDALPESLQESERGQQMEEAASNLSEAVDFLDEAIDSLRNAIEL